VVNRLTVEMVERPLVMVMPTITQSGSNPTPLVPFAKRETTQETAQQPYFDNNFSNVVGFDTINAENVFTITMGAMGEKNKETAPSQERTSHKRRESMGQSAKK